MNTAPSPAGEGRVETVELAIVWLLRIRPFCSFSEVGKGQSDWRGLRRGGWQRHGGGEGRQCFESNNLNLERKRREKIVW